MVVHGATSEIVLHLGTPFAPFELNFNQIKTSNSFPFKSQFFLRCSITQSHTSHKECCGRLGNGASEKELGFEWKRIRGLDLIEI